MSSADPDVSVVVVHGTGTQQRGDTVAEWVAGLLHFPRVQGRGAEPAVVTELDVGESEPEPVAATLHIGGPGSGGQVVVTDPAVRLRVVEAHWAEAFEPPTAGDVLRWLLWFAPSFAITQMVLEARAGAGAGRDAKRVLQLRPFAPLYSILLGLVGLTVLGPALLLAVLVLVVTAAVPSRRVREAAAGALGFLSQNIGDVQSFLIRPLARARMEQRVGAVVRAEVARWGPANVHVLAVSQGAALTHAALLRMPEQERPARLTTVGGAHGRLHDVRMLTPPTWTRIPIVLTGAVWLLGLPLVGALGPVLAASVVLGVTVLSVLALVLSAHERLSNLPTGAAEDPPGEPTTADATTAAAPNGHASSADAPTRDLPSPGPVGGVSWLDLWAPFDAVPNGRPVTAPGPGYRFVMVPGQMQILGDHVSYSRDWTETLPRILHHLTAHLPEHQRLGAPRGVRARAALGDPGGIGPNWRPWARRDWVALALRVLPVAAVIVGAVGPWQQQYREAGTAVAGLHPAVAATVETVSQVVQRVLSLFGPTESSAAGMVELVLGAGLALVLAVLVGVATTALFRAAGHAEAARWAHSLDAPPVRRWSVRRWTVVGTGVVVAWLGLVTLAGVLVSAPG